MKISSLLEHHKKGTHAHGLIKNWGDSYLLNHNPIYATVRKSAIKMGYVCSLDKNDFYLALPLSQLDWILENKKVPYSDNVSVVESVEAKSPRLVEWDDISDNLKKNYIFHESCHAVARHCFAGLKFNKNASSEITVSLLEESFANTCELLSVLYADDQVHRLFLEWNSYTHLFEERTNLLRAAKEFGGKKLFKFFLISYLHSNFLVESIDEKTLNKILLFVDINVDRSAKSLKVWRALLKITFNLNLRFRTVTTRFYLRSRGDRRPLKEILNFDFMSWVTSEPAIKSAIEDLTELFDWSSLK